MLSLAAPSLWVALVLGAASGLFAWRPKDVFTKAAADPLSSALAVGWALALWLLTIALGRALWKLDLSLTYVVDHARGGVSSWYRLAGLWGGASGSLLLLATMTSTALAAMVVLGPVYARRATLATLAVTTVGLVVGLATVAQPFGHLSIPAISGAGLQPILEHPAMLYHPPILYAGLVATVIPFVLVVAGPTDSQPGRLSLRSSCPVDPRARHQGNCAHPQPPVGRHHRHCVQGVGGLGGPAALGQRRKSPLRTRTEEPSTRRRWCPANGRRLERPWQG